MKIYINLSHDLPPSYKVSPADLTDLHVIRYEPERDMMALVLSNTQYSIERGQETLHEYDLPKIQQQIISRFLLGKPLITLSVSKEKKTALHKSVQCSGTYVYVHFTQGIPTLLNRHSHNYENVLKAVHTKVRQVSCDWLFFSALSIFLQVPVALDLPNHLLYTSVSVTITLN